MKRLKYIAPISLAGVFAVFYFLSNLLVNFSLVAENFFIGKRLGMQMPYQLSGFFPFSWEGCPTAEVILMIIAYPFLNAFLAAVSGAIMALLYNLYARLFGGIRFRLEDEL